MDIFLWDIPDTPTFIGAGIIALSGIFIIQVSLRLIKIFFNKLKPSSYTSSFDGKKSLQTLLLLLNLATLFQMLQ